MRGHFMNQIKTLAALKAELNISIATAVKNVAIVVCDKLHECIDEQYYRDPGFYPNIYQRTEAFLNSAVYEMLSNNTARVGVDTGSMHYKNGFSARKVVEYAAQSMHGAPMYQTDTEPFWDVFLEWADKNIPLLLKSELKKQGLNIK